MKFDPWLLAPCVSCFDGDEPAGEAETPAAAEDDGTPQSYSQDDVDQVLAEDRRKHQEKLQKMEQQLQDVLRSKGLSDQEKESLEGSLEDMRKQLRTKEEQAAHEKKKLESQFQSQLQEATESSERWRSMYHDSTISRALQDAAVKGEAFNPSQIMTLLRTNSNLSENEDGSYKVIVEFHDTNEKGEQVALTLSPDEAVERMREKPEVYGNLFKSNVVSGIGGNSATGGLMPGKRGKVDYTKLDPETYRKLRKENPELLGLRPRK